MQWNIAFVSSFGRYYFLLGIFTSFLALLLLRVDEKRIKEKGPDAACSEWLIRNGAYLQWKGLDGLHTNYVTLPAAIAQKRRIELIHAEDASISTEGFRHMG